MLKRAMTEQNISSFLNVSAAKLSAAGLSDPLPKARLFLAHILSIRPDVIKKIEQRALSQDNKSQIERLIDRHLQGEPVSRILGERYFYGLPFGLNEATLDPRFISEVLVDVAVGHFKHPFFERIWRLMRGISVTRAPRVLDLGTGTGCLLLSVLHSLPLATGVGVDLAPRALDQAIKNATNLNLVNRTQFILSNWFEKIDEPFDLIISNPPYIPRSELPKLMPRVAVYDPLMALDGGEDGLDAYRAIITQLPRYLKPNGLVVLEPGDNQEPAIVDMLEKAHLADVTCYKDMYHAVRCIAAKRPKV